MTYVLIKKCASKRDSYKKYCSVKAQLCENLKNYNIDSNKKQDVKIPKFVTYNSTIGHFS